MKPGFLLMDKQRGAPQEHSRDNSNCRPARENSSASRSLGRSDSLNSKIQSVSNRLDPKFLTKKSGQPSQDVRKPAPTTSKEARQNKMVNSQSIPDGKNIRVDVNLQKTPEKVRIFQDTWNTNRTAPHQDPQKLNIVEDTKPRGQKLFCGQNKLHSAKQGPNCLQLEPRIMQDAHFAENAPKSPMDTVHLGPIGVDPNFGALLSLFDIRKEVPQYELYQAVKYFFKVQLQKILGSCSLTSSPGAFSVKQHSSIDQLLVRKHRQIEVLNRILNLYQEYIQKSLPTYGGSLIPLAQKVWRYLYQEYSQRFKEYTAHCYHHLNRQYRQDLQQNKSHPHYYDAESIIDRIEQLNQLSSNQNSPTKSRIKIQDVCLTQLTSKIDKDMGFRTEFPLKADKDMVVYRQSLNQGQGEPLLIIRGKPHPKESQSSQQLYTRYKVVSKYRSQKSTSHQVKTSQEEMIKMLIDYDICIEWLGGQGDSEVLFEDLDLPSNSLELPGDPTFEEIQAEITLDFRIKYCEWLRSDCEIKLIPLKRGQKPRHYRTQITVSQRIVNLPEGYNWTVTCWAGKCVADSLQIGNRFGSVKWRQQMDLKMVDFAKGVFQIDERSVRCQSEELNKPCLMTFYGLPSEIKNKTSRNIQQRFSRFVKRMGEVSLVGIDRQNDSFKVKFSCFWSSPSKSTPDLASTALKSKIPLCD